MRELEAEAREGDKREAGERDPRADPAVQAERRITGVHRPRDERDEHERVEAASVLAEPYEADADPEGEEPGRDDDRAAGDAVEDDERRHPHLQDVRRVALETPRLPQIEAREPGRKREAGEGGEDEADVEDQEQVRVVPAGAEARAAARSREREE